VRLLRLARLSSSPLCPRASLFLASTIDSSSHHYHTTPSVLNASLGLVNLFTVLLAFCPTLFLGKREDLEEVLAQHDSYVANFATTVAPRALRKRRSNQNSFEVAAPKVEPAGRAKVAPEIELTTQLSARIESGGEEPSTRAPSIRSPSVRSESAKEEPTKDEPAIEVIPVMSVSPAEEIRTIGKPSAEEEADGAAATENMVREVGPSTGSDSGGSGSTPANGVTPTEETEVTEVSEVTEERPARGRSLLEPLSSVGDAGMNVDDDRLWNRGSSMDSIHLKDFGRNGTFRELPKLPSGQIEVVLDVTEPFGWSVDPVS